MSFWWYNKTRSSSLKSRSALLMALSAAFRSPVLISCLLCSRRLKQSSSSFVMDSSSSSTTWSSFSWTCADEHLHRWCYLHENCLPDESANQPVAAIRDIVCAQSKSSLPHEYDSAKRPLLCNFLQRFISCDHLSAWLSSPSLFSTLAGLSPFGSAISDALADAARISSVAWSVCSLFSISGSAAVALTSWSSLPSSLSSITLLPPCDDFCSGGRMNKSHLARWSCA